MSEITLIEVETGDQPTVAVIWMHGLGADGRDFEPVVSELGLANKPGIRFVFPNAPYRPVTCNGGYVMRAWYDIISLAPDRREIDEVGLGESREIVRALIAREEARGIPSHRIFLAGFSQGGAVAYLSALTHPMPLAGVIALSTYIPCPQWITDERSAANMHIPMFVAHGRDDDVVSLSLGEQALALVSGLGFQPVWHTYDMPHAVCAEEIADIGAWLNERVSELAD